ncbi:MAG TPA: hypothetical protein VHO50_10770 [Bacteroidales bacterium]|nr:hypothetical protein [Bacteroidales bacterium]
MKKLLLLFFGFWILTSCDKEFYLDNFPQKWQLISMYGQIPNSTVSGADMEWQESYLLNSDGTFTKSRTRNGVLTEASGTFLFKDINDEKYLVLYFDNNSSIIGSCTYYNLQESFWVRSEKRMTGTWSNCDGPGLEYTRIKL